MGARDIYNKAIGSYPASNPLPIEEARQAAEDLQRRTFGVNATDAATAATAVTETVVAHVRRAGILKSVTIATPIAVATHATNIATFTVSKRTAAGAAVTVATGSTVTGTSGLGNFVAFVPKVIPLTNANVGVAPGDVLTLSVAKGGTGVALTAATSTFHASVDVLETDAHLVSP